MARTWNSWLFGRRGGSRWRGFRRPRHDDFFLAPWAIHRTAGFTQGNGERAPAVRAAKPDQHGRATCKSWLTFHTNRTQPQRKWPLESVAVDRITLCNRIGKGELNLVRCALSNFFSLTNRRTRCVCRQGIWPMNEEGKKGKG